MFIRHFVFVSAIALSFSHASLPTASPSVNTVFLVDSVIPWEADFYDIESIENQTMVFVLTSNPQHEYFYEEHLVRIMRTAESQVYILGLATLGAIATTVCLAMKFAQHL